MRQIVSLSLECRMVVVKPRIALPGLWRSSLCILSLQESHIEDAFPSIFVALCWIKDDRKHRTGGPPMSIHRASKQVSPLNRYVCRDGRHVGLSPVPRRAQCDTESERMMARKLESAKVTTQTE